MKMNEYYGFSVSPFSDKNQVLYKSKDYMEIKKRMEFYLEEEGIALITGLHGTGKTKMVQSLLPGKDKVIYVYGCELTLFEFLNSIGSQLEIETKHCHISNIMQDINRRVVLHTKNEERVIIVIDRIEKIQSKILESLKSLQDGSKGIYLILIGHSKFRSRSRDPKLKSLISSILINYDCAGLSMNETKEYIKLRLANVGGDINLIEDRYYSNIYEYTKGNPQMINKYMATVLLIAYINQTKTINNQILKKAKEEIEI